MKKKLLIISVILIISIPFLIWAGALLKGEMLTALYLDEFEEAFSADEELMYFTGGYDYAKVLSYSKSNAKVYYVHKGKYGHIATYTKTDEQWIAESVDTRWSTQGNADETVFPYFKFIFN